MPDLADILTRLFNPHRYYFKKLRAEMNAAEWRLTQRLEQISDRSEQILATPDIVLATAAQSPMSVAARHGALILTEALMLKATSTPGRIAVVSPLPPAQTGVAHATLNTFAAWDAGVDFFGDLGSAADLQVVRHLPILAGGPHRVLQIDFLPEALDRFDYQAVIFAFGNSPHNLQVVSWLLRCRSLSRLPPVLAYVHDPVVFDVLRGASEALGLTSDELFRRAYDHPSLVLLREGTRMDLMEQDICGLRAIRREAPLDGILVNSAAAKALLLADDPGLEPDRVATLFHPVFTPRPMRPGRDRARSVARKLLRLGCFGVQTANKQPDVVLAAVRLLRDRGVEARLVMAGYEVNEFAAANALEGLDFVELCQNPDNGQLLDLMASVDVAVQLRRQNTGETSGIVSQLMGLGVPTIVSQVGAFQEFADAVRFVAPDCNPEELADAMLAVHVDAELYSQRASSFAALRTPKTFCLQLARAIDQLKETGGEPNQANDSDHVRRTSQG